MRNYLFLNMFAWINVVLLILCDLILTMAFYAYKFLNFYGVRVEEIMAFILLYLKADACCHYPEYGF